MEEIQKMNEMIQIYMKIKEQHDERSRILLENEFHTLFYSLNFRKIEENEKLFFHHIPMLVFINILVDEIQDGKRTDHERSFLLPFFFLCLRICKPFLVKSSVFDLKNEMIQMVMVMISTLLSLFRPAIVGKSFCDVLLRNLSSFLFEFLTDCSVEFVSFMIPGFFSTLYTILSHTIQFSHSTILCAAQLSFFFLSTYFSKKYSSNSNFNDKIQLSLDNVLSTNLKNVQNVETIPLERNMFSFFDLLFTRCIDDDHEMLQLMYDIFMKWMDTHFISIWNAMMNSTLKSDRIENFFQQWILLLQLNILRNV